MILVLFNFTSISALYFCPSISALSPDSLFLCAIFALHLSSHFRALYFVSSNSPFILVPISVPYILLFISALTFAPYILRPLCLFFIFFTLQFSPVLRLIFSVLPFLFFAPTQPPPVFASISVLFAYPLKYFPALSGFCFYFLMSSVYL